MIDYAVSESFWHRVHSCAMKYAIISDIHANPTAFKAVLADARRQKADRIVCLGDVTGFGCVTELTTAIYCGNIAA